MKLFIIVAIAIAIVMSLAIIIPIGYYLWKFVYSLVYAVSAYRRAKARERMYTDPLDQRHWGYQVDVEEKLSVENKFFQKKSPFLSEKC